MHRRKDAQGAMGVARETCEKDAQAFTFSGREFV